MSKSNIGILGAVAALLTLGVSMNAFGFLGFGDSASWKEEVLLHDGSKIIVERKVERGGRHEIGQKPPYKEQNLSFALPVTSRVVKWEDHHSEDIGTANFLPMVLDIVNGTPYLVVTPMGCLSYNKWGRPNPPYIVFRHDGKTWQRVALQELPPEITTPNLIFSMPDIEAEKLGKDIVSAEAIKKLVGSYQQPQYRAILREPLAEAQLCPDWSSPRYTSPKAPIPIPPKRGDGDGK